MCVVTPSLHRRHTSSLVVRDRNKYKAYSVNHRHGCFPTDNIISSVCMCGSGRGGCQWCGCARMRVWVCAFMSRAFLRERERKERNRVCVTSAFVCVTSVFERERERMCVTSAFGCVCLYQERDWVCLCDTTVCVCHECVGVSMTWMCLSVYVTSVLECVCLCHKSAHICDFVTNSHHLQCVQNVLTALWFIVLLFILFLHLMRAKILTNLKAAGTDTRT